MSVAQLVPADQAEGQKGQRIQRRRSRSNRAFAEVIIEYATQPGVLTLQQAREIAADYLADLIVTWVENHPQGFSQLAATEGGEQ